MLLDPFEKQLDLPAALVAVSYTHLDVYKRQVAGQATPAPTDDVPVIVDAGIGDRRVFSSAEGAFHRCSVAVDGVLLAQNRHFATDARQYLSLIHI